MTVKRGRAVGGVRVAQGRRRMARRTARTTQQARLMRRRVGRLRGCLMPRRSLDWIAVRARDAKLH